MIGTICGHVTCSSAVSYAAGTAKDSSVTGTLPFMKILVKFRTRMVKMSCLCVKMSNNTE
jgi:hypothetical protein